MVDLFRWKTRPIVRHTPEEFQSRLAPQQVTLCKVLGPREQCPERHLLRRSLVAADEAAAVHGEIGTAVLFSCFPGSTGIWYLAREPVPNWFFSSASGLSGCWCVRCQALLPPRLGFQCFEQDPHAPLPQQWNEACWRTPNQTSAAA